MNKLLTKAINEFLKERRVSDGSGLAPITPKDVEQLDKIIYRLLQAKCAPDYSGERPIEWQLVNRRTHRRMHYRPIPYDVADPDTLLWTLENLRTASDAASGVSNQILTVLQEHDQWEKERE